MQRVEALREDLVEEQQAGGIVSGKEVVRQPEIVFIIKNVQVLDHHIVGNVVAAEGYCLVEQGQSVAHRSVGFLGYDVQSVVADGDLLRSRYILHIAHHISNRDTVEIVCLAAREDGRKDLVLLGGGQDEDGVCRRLLEGLQ